MDASQADTYRDTLKPTKGDRDMFNVTEKASEMVREFFKTREKVEPLRIFIAGVG